MDATATPDDRLRLPYRPRGVQVTAGLAFFAAASICFARWAAGGQGLILNGIELGPTAATTFKLACAAASAGMAGVAALFLVPQSLRRDRHLALDADAIAVPVWHGWSDASVRVPASALTAVTIITARGATFLRLRHDGGVERINSSHLDRHEDIDAIVRWIGERRPDLLAA